jgi:Right handed beta helix region
MNATRILTMMLGVVLAVGGACKNSKYCDDGSNPCPATMTCNLTTHACMSGIGGAGGTGGKTDGGGGGKTDGGTGGGGSGGHPFRCDASTQCTGRDDGSAPVCELDAASCVGCLVDGDCTGDMTKPICGSDHTCGPCVMGTTNQCASHTGKTVCARSGSCVECVTSSDCMADKTKPICGTTNQCQPCVADSDCTAAPGVCMTDGHCAATTEVLYVQFNSSGCPTPDGSLGNPYCAPNDAVGHLALGIDVIIIVGAANNQMTLNTSVVSPVVIGRKDSAGNVGSILAGASTALTASAGTVLIRDLTVDLGATSTSKGILVTGSSTKVSLLRVTASLGTGLGIDAENGANLAMDRCLVQANSVGGILVGAATYSIQNSIIAGNGYGVKFAASATSTGSEFSFNTIVGNVGDADTCDSSNMLTLSNSVILGLNDSCNLVNVFTTAPTGLETVAPYHLTASIGCPGNQPTVFPSDDFDGTLRTAPVDCDADQYVAP